MNSRLIYITGRSGFILISIGLSLLLITYINITYSYSTSGGGGKIEGGYVKVILADYLSPLDNAKISVDGRGLKIIILTSKSGINIMAGELYDLPYFNQLTQNMSILIKAELPYQCSLEFPEETYIIIGIVNEYSGIASYNYEIRVSKRHIPISRIRLASNYLLFIGIPLSIPLIIMKIKGRFIK